VARRAARRGADGLVHAPSVAQTSVAGKYQGWAVLLKHLRESGQYGYGSFPDYPAWVRHNETLLFEQRQRHTCWHDGDLHQVAYTNSTVPRTFLGGGIGPDLRQGPCSRPWP